MSGGGVSSTIEIPFSLGETLWTPGYGNAKKRVTCPECAGTKAIEMIKGNGERVSLPCDHCTRAWESPLGWIEIDAWCSAPEMFIPARVDMRGNEFWYSESPPEANGYSSRSAKDLFRTRDECAVRCAALDADRERNFEEMALRRIANSRQNLSRNASYWSRRVNEIARDLERAKAKLATCKVKPEAALAAKQP
jgi:hypothetical protein